MTFKLNEDKCRNCGHEGKYHHKTFDIFGIGELWCDKCSCKEWKDPLRKCGICHTTKECNIWKIKLKIFICDECKRNEKKK